MSDALYNAILGVQPSKGAAPPVQKSAPSTGGDIQISDAVLDSLRRVESGKDQFALNKQSKAMGPYQFIPETVQMLHKQGYKFNPFDEAEAREMARVYLTTLSKRSGSIEGGLAAYGGHITKDPKPYVSNVLGGTKAETKTETQATVSEDLLYNAILGTKPKQAPVSQQDIEKATAIRSGFPEEDLSRPVTVNRRLARQGEKMREQGSKLQPFVQEVAKPLESISAQDWKDKSLAAPAIEYTAASIGIPGFTEADKKAAQEKLVKKGKAFVEGVNQFIESPVQTTKQALSALAENPGKFIGESVKSVIYDPEQVAIGGVAAKVAGDAVTGTQGLVKKGAEVVAETPVYQGLANKAKGAKEVLQESFQAYKQAQAPQGQVVPAGASVGAAQTANKSVIDEALTRASPELSRELTKLDPKDVNIDVLNRHLDADTLPIRIQLSEGQATRNPQLFSDEMNNRGKNKELSNRYNQQNKQLVENIDAIKENAAPRVYGTNVVENGQSLIDAYLDIDKARKDAIGTAYTALKDKAGGSFPIDSKKFAENAYANLDKELKTEFLPDSLKKQIDGFKDGKPMSFQQFEALRTNLAAEMRKADRAGDGNTEFALSTVRQALEDLPLVGETKDLKALADTARGLAKERFDILDSDKAYKAAVNGKVAPDDFINKFVVNGKKNDIDTMVAHLGADSQAREVMAAGIVNWLKSKSGISSDGQGTFSQSGFNKALDNIDPKILNIVGPEVNKQLKALGNTARNIQERPVGGYVNESNTLVGAIAEKAKSGIEFGLNVAGGGQYGIPIGTMLRGGVRNAQEAKKVRESLKPGAGIKLKDIGKE
jgi:hypothetical protein